MRYAVFSMQSAFHTVRTSDIESKPRRQTLADCRGAREQFPFRLGTTSYIVPDDILPNVRALAETVADIELVVFESDEISNLPSPAVAEELRALADAHRLTYTLHLPMDAYLGSSEERVRRAGVGKCLRVIDRLRPAQPFANVIHFHHESFPGEFPIGDLPRWKAALDASLRELLDAGVPPRSLCVETLTYPFAWIEDLVSAHGLSVCLDVGHLMLTGRDVAGHLDRYWPRTRIVHLHGIREGRDHRDIAAVDEQVLTPLIERLCADGEPRVLTLEVFNEPDLVKSLERLEAYAR